MLRVFRLFGPLSGGPEHRKTRNFAEASSKAASEEATSKDNNLEEGNLEGKGLGYHVPFLIPVFQLAGGGLKFGRLSTFNTCP